MVHLLLPILETEMTPVLLLSLHLLPRRLMQGLVLPWILKIEPG